MQTLSSKLLKCLVFIFHPCRHTWLKRRLNPQINWGPHHVRIAQQNPTNIFKIVQLPGINIPKAQVVVNSTDALAVTCKTIHRCQTGFSMAENSKALGAILGLAMASCGPLSRFTRRGPCSYSLPQRYFYCFLLSRFCPNSEARKKNWALQRGLKNNTFL